MALSEGGFSSNNYLCQTISKGHKDPSNSFKKKKLVSKIIKLLILVNQEKRMPLNKRGLLTKQIKKLPTCKIISNSHQKC